MPPMRILMCAGFYDVGGFSTVMEQLADKLVEQGHEVTVGALLFKRFPSKGAYTVVRIPVNNVLKLRRFLEDFDLVHSHHAITNYLALVCRKPFIYHYHGAPNFGTGYLYRLSMLSSIKMMKHALAAVIAVSESGAAELKQYFNLYNVYVIYNGVNTRLFKPGLQEKFRMGKPQFLFVGNLYEHKNVEDLIFALKDLIKIYPSAHLQIVGTGHSYTKLVRLAHELSIQEKVSFYGFVFHDNLPSYYASCDVYVTASRCEQFPLPLVEAWACGKPVIASNIPAHLSLLKESGAGIAYKTGDISHLVSSMVYIYEHKDEYSKKGLTFARNNDWSLVAERVKKFYKLAIENYT